jgi:tetratricopeptide (TPR) repeat protein
MVRKGGFEPPRLSAPPPQDGVSASSTTSALAFLATPILRGLTPNRSPKIQGEGSDIIARNWRRISPPDIALIFKLASARIAWKYSGHSPGITTEISHRKDPQDRFDPALKGTALPEAKLTLEQLSEQFRQAELVGDPWKQGIALNNLGSYYKDRREFPSAVSYFQKALEFFTALDDNEKKATVLINLGGTYLDQKEHGKALEQFAMALGTYASLDHPFGQGMALNNMGGVHLTLRRHEDARNQFILAASFFRSANAAPWEGQALENEAAAEAGIGETDNAVQSYGRALEIWQRLENHERQALIMNRLAALHSSRGDRRRALDLHARALTLAHKGKNVALSAATRTSMAKLYFEVGNLNAARAEFQAALISYEELRDKRGQATALLHLGKIDIATGHDMIATAAKMFREAGDAEGEQSALEALPAREEAEAAKDKPA